MPFFYLTLLLLVKLDVESSSLPSVITIGWDEWADVENMVTFSPKFFLCEFYAENLVVSGEWCNFA